MPSKNIVDFANLIKDYTKKLVHWGDQSKGYVGKNFLKFPYSDGFKKTLRNVTFTVNDNGEVTITGKNDNTGNSGFVLCDEFTLEQLGLKYGVDYTLTGCPQGGVSDVSYTLDFRERTGHNVDNPNAPLHRDLGSGVTFRLHENTTLVHIYIDTFRNYDNNEVFRPMLRLASIADNTYEPPLTPNTEIDNKVSYADNTVLGTKNIIPPSNPSRDTSKSQNGVSWTLNADGTVTGTTNGVASTGESRFTITGYIPFTDSLIKKNKAYKISAEVPSDAPNAVRFEIALWRDESTYDGVRYYQDKTSEETAFTITSATANGYSLYLLVPSGTTISSPITFKPMIRLASDTDKTYQPPTMTNRELTQENKYHAGDIITFHGLSGYISSGATELFCQINGKFDESVSAIQISGTDVRVRGSKGYIKDDNSVELAGVNFATYLKLNSFLKFTNQINVSIKTLSGNAFTNVDNNTPISISGTFTITLS